MSRPKYNPVTGRFYVQLTLIDYLAPVLWLISAWLWLVVILLLLRG